MRELRSWRLGALIGHVSVLVVLLVARAPFLAYMVAGVGLAAAMSRRSRHMHAQAVTRGLAITLAALGLALTPGGWLRVAAGAVLYAAGVAEIGASRANASARLQRAWALGAALPVLLDLLAAALGPRFGSPLSIVSWAARLGVFPLHAWLIVVVSEAPAVLVAPLIIAKVSQGAPASVETALAGLPLDLATWLGLLTVSGAALASLVRRDAKRVIAWITVSHSGMLFAAAVEGKQTVALGASLLVTSTGLALAGLLLVFDAIEARLAERVSAVHTGLSHGGRQFAAFALCFAGAAIAVPGSAGFIAADMLIDGLLQARPWTALSLVSATVLTAIAVGRLVLLAFFGRSRGATMPHDVLGYERLALATVLALLIVMSGSHG